MFSTMRASASVAATCSIITCLWCSTVRVGSVIALVEQYMRVDGILTCPLSSDTHPSSRGRHMWHKYMHVEQYDQHSGE